jgi:catecholate siderophore receptor
MSDIKSSQAITRPAAPAFLALSCVGFIASVPAMAADAAPPAAMQSSVDDGQIIVTGERQKPKLESPKALRPLLDTPQTVTVIGDQTIRKQNLLTLRDALSTIPGITFGAGEGGGGYGDKINLRGYSADNDVTQDGVRDSAQYSRSDPFDLQQIEVYNGANSAFNGSGSVGGTINLVSKVPQRRDLSVFQAGIGTDDYYRGTVDSNVRLGELAAVRLNAVYHRNDIPGRDFEHVRRWGVAPAVTFGIEGPTSFTLAYLHQRDDNVPVYGIPYFRNRINDGPLAEAHDSDYFGYRNLDLQRVTVDRLTATFHHDFSESVSLRNLTRWQRVAQLSHTSAPQGTFCLAATGRQPVAANGTDTVGLPCLVGLTPGFYQPTGPRGLVRDQENRLLFNQTDLRIAWGRKGGVHNEIDVGGALSRETYGIETAQLARNPDGSAAVLPIDSISDPSALYTGPVNYTVTARASSVTRNAAVYAFDTLELGPMFELNGGVRYEGNKAEFRNRALASYPPGTVPLTPLQLAPQQSDETLFSYRFGAVFKPAPNVSLYAAYANAKTPSSATVRLGCGVVAAPGGADPCATAPESARSYELGLKADIFERRLQFTAALFRNERSNYRVPSNDLSLPAGLQVLDGRSRVDGIALGLSGNIGRNWSVFANYTYLDSRVLQSVSDFCLADPGATGCANSVTIPDPQHGNQLIQTPKHAGSLFTTYRLPFGLEIGYGLTYQGRFALNTAVLANPVQYRAGDFLTHRLFLSYDVAKGLTAQLNVQNLTNAHYFTTIRNNINVTTGAISGGWATPGEARSAVLSLFYSL